LNTTNIQRKIFLRGPSVALRCFSLSLLAIILMVVDNRYQRLEHFRSAISTAVYPLRAVAHAPYKATAELGNDLRTQKRLRAENTLLREELKQANYALQNVHRLQTENERLRALLDSGNAKQLELQMTEIMRVSLDPTRHHIILNQGKESDLQQGHAVIDEKGLMGQIVRADAMQSEVILITDSKHATPIEVNRNGLRSIAYGTGEKNTLNLPYFAQNADLEVGDILVTSGLGGRFPSGIPVAKITDIQFDQTKNFLNVSASPLAALEQSRQVAIVHLNESLIARDSRKTRKELANNTSVTKAN